MRVVVTDYIEPNLDWEALKLAEHGIGFAFHQLKFAPLAEVAAATRDADIVVVNMVPVTRELVRTWTRCKLVIRHGVGYDNVDLGALREAGIPLCYIPDYCVDEVAEQAIALIFACGRRLPTGRRVLEASSRNGRWDFTDTIPVFRMGGRKLGILGCGRIGCGGIAVLKLRGIEPTAEVAHRSSRSSPVRSRANPRRSWVFIVPSGRPVWRAISSSVASPKKRSATTSRYGSGSPVTAARSSVARSARIDRMAGSVSGAESMADWSAALVIGSTADGPAPGANGSRHVTVRRLPA